MRRYVIIGNGAAGITAAEELRRRDPASSLTILSDEPYPMYSRPGLAYVLIDEVSAEQTIARKPEWYARLHIKLVYGRAEHIDCEARLVHLADHSILAYDALLIAVGARAVQAPFPGSQLDGVVYLDNLDNTLDLIERAKASQSAVVVGGGVTALEMAEGLAHHEVETYYFVRKTNLWSALFNDRESQLLEPQIQHHGVHLHYRTEIAEIIGRRGHVEAVKTDRGEIIPCQIVGAAIGVRPNVTLAKGTPIAFERGILTDEYLQTNIPGIYAAGDCAQMFDVWSGEHRCDSLWPTAVASGRAAAANMAGANQPYRKGVPFNAALVFGLHVTAIGQVAAAGRDDLEVEELSFISRGSSEVWTAKPGSGYASAWSDDGTSSQRLILRDNKIVGALLLGNQRLADPIRDLIDQQVDIAPAIHARMLAGGRVLADTVMEVWQRHQAAAPITATPIAQRRRR